jgi:hypothetical protein
MMRPVLLAAALAVLTAPARAAGPEDCRPLRGIGCWFAPEDAPADAPLLVYLRGHHGVYGPDVPAGLWLTTSRQAFAAFDLGRIAAQKGVVVLVTYRSGLGVRPEDVAALAAESKRTFPRTIVAAHSGGYVGLGRTLDSGLSPARVVMLDDFYGAGVDGLAQKLQRAVSAGAACSGFYTPHNKKNYEAGFRRAVACSVDGLSSDSLHDPAVNRCLAGYIDGRSCL